MTPGTAGVDPSELQYFVLESCWLKRGRSDAAFRRILADSER